MSDVVNVVPHAIGELGGAIQSVVGLSRHSRLRAQIRDTLVLYSAAKEHDELTDAQAALARVITLQTAELLAGLDPSRAGQRDWGGAIVGLVLTALIGTLAWAMWVPWDLRRWWWGWILIAVVVAVGLLLLAVSLSLLKKQPPKVVEPPPEETAPNDPAASAPEC